MNIADQVARLESEIAQLSAELETQRRRNNMQAGALAESRAENGRLILRNEKLAAQCARYDKHFRDALASGENLAKCRANLEPDKSSPFNIISCEPTKPTLRDRIARMARRNGGEAA